MTDQYHEATDDERQRWKRLLQWHRSMLNIRLFETKVRELYLGGLVPGTTHLCEGQEAVCVGAVSAMQAQDYLTITYRGHGQALARGVSIRGALAELMGRRSGLCRGLGGSMHFADVERGLLGASAIVGGGIPVAVGAAFSSLLQGRDAVALTFFGDGAANIGTFHESLNMAAVWKAPVVFICENNLYGEFSPLSHTTPITDLAERSTSYGMPGGVVDGQNVEAVYDSVAGAVAHARSGAGPTLLEMKTYRYSGHSRSDPAKYRSPVELTAWKARDPLALTEAQLLEAGVASKDDLRAIRTEVQAEIDEAAAVAAEQPYPTMSDVYECI